MCSSEAMRRLLNPPNKANSMEYVFSGFIAGWWQTPLVLAELLCKPPSHQLVFYQRKCFQQFPQIHLQPATLIQYKASLIGGCGGICWRIPQFAAGEKMAGKNTTLPVAKCPRGIKLLMLHFWSSWAVVFRATADSPVRISTEEQILYRASLHFGQTSSSYWSHYGLWITISA